MEVLFVLIPVSIALAAASVVACLVAIRAGQYDDMESPRWRMLFDPSKSQGIVGSEKVSEDLVNEKPRQVNPGAQTGAKTRRSKLI